MAVLLHSVDMVLACGNGARSRDIRGQMRLQLFKFCGFSLLYAASSMAQTPQPIGTVGMQDATVAGALEVSNGRAILVGNTTVTARDRVAEIELKRGGMVRVGSRGGLHGTGGRGAGG